MATYFHGGAPDIQPVDGLQTLYLMNPSYVAYADSSSPTSHHHHHHHHNNNMVFLNSPLTSLTPPVPQQQPPAPQQHFVGIPLHNLQDSSTSLQGYNNLWGTAAPNMINSIDFQMKRAAAAAATSSPAQQQQGLSLSLSQEVAAGGGGDQEVKMVGVMGSKYLKAAQELLDEVVSVGNSKGIDNGGIMEKRVKESNKMAGKEEEEGGGDGGGGDLSTAERQELQMKKAKLVNMLDEVEQRYRQYHHQMQMVVSSFEVVAGYGSAKSYTALALQTISKQFRCLRDTISNQVRATSKSLGGEEDCLPLAGAGGSKSSVGSRLRFVDHHIRQQRALQQLGMMQHNAWRPQRGLPERAVSVLRAWLFEHFLHPYPKDSDKHMLAKQTGLTRSQVSNWFINARVRLWKPMVEEMYLEETNEREQSNDNNNTTTTKISKSETSDHSLSPSKSPSHQPTTSSPSVADHHPKHSSPLSSALHSSSDFNMMFTDESLIQQRMKKPRTTTTTTTNENQMPDELSNRELLMKFMDQGGAFGGYPMSEIARFDHHEQFPPPRFGANGVSLTLGLPHCEYLSTESIQMGRSIEMNTAENNNYFNLNNTNGNNLNNPSSSHTPSGYESINIQNRKRFSAQLLPDYVA